MIFDRIYLRSLPVFICLKTIKIYPLFPIYTKFNQNLKQVKFYDIDLNNNAKN